MEKKIFIISKKIQFFSFLFLSLLTQNYQVFSLFLNATKNFFSFSEQNEPEKIISLPIELNFGSFYAKLSLGNPPQEQIVALDQELSVTWTDFIHYKQNNSNTSEIIDNNVILGFRKYTLSGKSVKDSIYLEMINSEYYNNNFNENVIVIDDFLFVVIGTIKGYDSRVGGFGLTYKITNESYSLVHQLKKNKYIDHLSYAYVPVDLINNNNKSINFTLYNINNKEGNYNYTYNDTKNKDEDENQKGNINKNIKFNDNIRKQGKIIFGGLPKEYIEDKYRTDCKITGKYNFWSCKLSIIFFGEISYLYDNQYYQNNDYTYFNGAERRILAPEKFMLYLKEKYFRSQIESNHCEYKMYGMNYIFECDCKLNNTFPDISFIFDSYQYKISSEELFEPYGGGKCIFTIQSNHLRKDNFLIGTPFLKKYISNFDYEKSYISFYSNNGNNWIDLDRLFPWKKLVRYCVEILIFLGISAIGVVAYYKIKRYKKKEKRKMLLKIKKDNKYKTKNPFTKKFYKNEQDYFDQEYELEDSF